MTMPMDSQQLESFVPVYDVVPEKWEDAREFLVEHLKKISNAVNAREIGFFLDQELLSGKAFIPGVNSAPTNNPGQFRQILRIVVNCSPLAIGLNTFPHGIVFDANFTLIQMYAAATNRPPPPLTPFKAEPIPNGADTITMDATNIYITVAATWIVCFATIEYLQEL